MTTAEQRASKPPADGTGAASPISLLELVDLLERLPAGPQRTDLSAVTDRMVRRLLLST